MCCIAYIPTTVLNILAKIKSVYYLGKLDEQKRSKNTTLDKLTFMHSVMSSSENSAALLWSLFASSGEVFPSAAFLMRFSSSLRNHIIWRIIWHGIRMKDDQQKTFQPNLRLLSFSPALAGKDKPWNTTIGMTRAFFTEIKHFWKISPHLGN